MKKMGNNVEKFNDYVKLQMNDLSARGSFIDDAYIVTNLFLAYLSVDDKTFHAYVTKQQDDYNDNVRDFNVQSLMDLALNKYKTLVEAEKWEAPTADSQIVALTARLSNLENKKGSATKKKESGDPKKKKKKPADEATKRQNDKKWAWKTKAPKGKDSKTKKVEGKIYHWCPKHVAWTLHSPADCRKGVSSDNASNNPNNSSADGNSNSNPSAKILKLSNALVSIIEDDDDE
jgi:hypothetical protein